MKSNDNKLFVYMRGFAGNLGTKVLIENKKELLLKHFSLEYLSHIINEVEDGLIPSSLNIPCIDRERIGKGGVLASLWIICERNKYGLNYSLRDIPIHQGTIEIANFFDINPYRLLTDNSELFIADKNIYEMKDYFDNDKIKCIGEITDCKKRVRIDGDTESFLIRCYKDEIDKV